MRQLVLALPLVLMACTEPQQQKQSVYRSSGSDGIEGSICDAGLDPQQASAFVFTTGLRHIR